jgi:hypothetical protein
VVGNRTIPSLLNRVFYRFLRRILRRHAFFHLLVPLVAGVAVEALYYHCFDYVAWPDIPTNLGQAHAIALYAGIVLAYFVVIGILIRTETSIGIEHLHLRELEKKLSEATGLFAIATTPFDEWFDPGMQVYLATLFRRRLDLPAFRYERVLLLAGRSAEKDLKSQLLDGYPARCLSDIHDALKIDLYFLLWPQIRKILHDLSDEERILIGYYPEMFRRLPHTIIRLVMWPLKRRRVRRVAVGVLDLGKEGPTAFEFTKKDKVVKVPLQSEERVKAYAKMAALIHEQPMRKLKDVF